MKGIIRIVKESYYVYDNDRKDFDNDGYRRTYFIRTYLFNILIFNRELTEYVERKELKDRKVGF